MTVKTEVVDEPVQRQEVEAGPSGIKFGTARTSEYFASICFYVVTASLVYWTLIYLFIGTKFFIVGCEKGLERKK